MTGSAVPYCVARFVRDLDPLQEEVAALGTFEEVVTQFRATHCWFADRMADQRIEDEPPDKVPIGGFGVQLRNRWGGEVEVGVGREVWFLMLHQPAPARCYSDRPPLDGYLAFWLCGWHHTELGRDMLVSRAACLEAVRQWLETGEFP